MLRVLLSIVLLLVINFSFCEDFKYFLDRESEYSIETVVLQDTLFDTTGNCNFNFGFTTGQLWLQFEKTNPSGKDSTLIVSINYPLLNQIDYYEIKNGEIQKTVKTGDFYPFESREINERNFSFKLHLAPKESKIVYFRINNTRETLRVPLKIESIEQFYQRIVKEKFGLSPYYGFIVFGVILNLMLFISLRDRVYIYFSLYVTFLASFVASSEGLVFELFLRNNHYLADRSLVILIGFACFFFMAFTREFLKMAKLHRTTEFVFKIIMVISLLISIGAFFPRPYYFIVIKIANFFTIIVVTFAISMAIAGWAKKYKPARIFCVSFIILMLGVFIYVSRNLGMLPHNAFTSNGVKIGIAIQVVFLSFAVSERFRKLMYDTKDELECEVKLRTAELEAQRDYLSVQKSKIESQNILITDSIKYAERIQNAVMPSTEYCNEIFKEHFKIYLPCDIVSGDFYWILKKYDDVFIAVADCTGHGVSAGFLSMLGVSFLNEIGTHNHAKKPNEILNILRSQITHTLTSKSLNETKDGLDIGMCKINTKTLMLEYAGAHISAYIVRDGILHELKADVMPVGKYVKETGSFNHKSFQLESDDVLYLFTDGYADQIGSQNKKKFKKRTLKNLLIENHRKPLHEQHTHLLKVFETWKGYNIQTDDVLLFGVRI